MNEPTLPHNDKDLELARRLGKLLEARKLSEEEFEDNPFENALISLKKRHNDSRTTPALDEARSEEMWEAIDTATRPAMVPHRPRARIFSLNSPVYRVALAASLLFAIILGWLVLYQPATTVQLVAEAGNSTFLYRLDDGSEITLRPHSQLFSMSNHLFKLEGGALFDIETDPDRTFRVEAGMAEISVLGTTFNIVHRDTTVSVYLEEGRIELAHRATNERLILSPGQAGMLSESVPITIEESADSEEYLDWIDNEITFSEERISEIVKELEFHFDITVELPEDRADETLSGFLPLTSVEAALEKLSFAMGAGRFVQIEANRYRFEPTG